MPRPFSLPLCRPTFRAGKNSSTAFAKNSSGERIKDASGAFVALTGYGEESHRARSRAAGSVGSFSESNFEPSQSTMSVKVPPRSIQNCQNWLSRRVGIFAALRLVARGWSLVLSKLVTAIFSKKISRRSLVLAHK